MAWQCLLHISRASINSLNFQSLQKRRILTKQYNSQLGLCSTASAASAASKPQLLGLSLLIAKSQSSGASSSNSSSSGNGSVSVYDLQSSTSSSGIYKRKLEERIERAIFNCRFLTLFAVVGSLAGSLLCFLKGTSYVTKSFTEYFMHCFFGTGTFKVILLLVEAVDVYLVGTVMLIFGMGLYELFVSTLNVPGGICSPDTPRATVCGSNFFGLFRLRERPRWLEIRSLDELKTKLGHVIVMILLVGMFEKSKKIPVNSSLDLLFLATSILLSSGSLFLLSKLQH